MKNIFSIMIGALFLLVCATVALSDNSVAICHTPPPTDFTIYVDHHAVPAHLAHGDYLGECVDEPTTTTTTLCNSTSTTTIPEPTTTTLPPVVCEDVPIERDPAILKWSNQVFKIHGRVTPTDPNTPVDGIGVTLETVEDGFFVATGCVLQPRTYRNNAWQCSSGTTRATVKKRVQADGTVTYPFRLKTVGWISEPSSALITTRIAFICNVGENTAVWEGTLGKSLRNAF